MNISHKANTGKRCKKLTLEYTPQSDYEQEYLAQIRNAILTMGDLEFLQWIYNTLEEQGYIE